MVFFDPDIFEKYSFLFFRTSLNFCLVDSLSPLNSDYAFWQEYNIFQEVHDIGLSQYQQCWFWSLG